MIKINNIKRTFKVKKTKEEFQALKDISLEFPNNGFVFLTGKSGSGKSTLLNILGGLDKADSGEIIIKGKSSTTFKAKDFDSYRNTYLGFVFQEYNLLDKETIRKNIKLALELQSYKGDMNEKIEAIATEVELLDKLDNKVNAVSGGQKQRVAIARALVKNPEIIIADEPTGNLDSKTGDAVMDLLKNLAKTKLVILVTHDVDYAAEYADRVIELSDGVVIKDETIKERSLEKVSTIDLTSGLTTGSTSSTETPGGLTTASTSSTETPGGLTTASTSSTETPGGLISCMRIPKGKKIDTDFIDSVNEHILNNPDDDLFISVSDSKDDIAKIDPQIIKLSEAEKGKSEKITLDYSKKDDFKLIKSRFPNKDASRFGATNIWNRKISLIFTFVLLVVSLSMFGYSETARTYEFSDTVEKIVHDEDIEIIEISTYNQDDFSLFEETYGNNYVLEITNLRYYSDNQYAWDNQNSCNTTVSVEKSSKYLPTCYTDGYMQIEDFSKTGFNNELLYGDMPTLDDEVLITDYMLASLMKNSMLYTKNYNGTDYKVIERHENVYGLPEEDITKDNIIGSIIFGGMRVSGVIETDYAAHIEYFDNAQSYFTDGGELQSSVPISIKTAYSKWVSYKRYVMYPITLSENPQDAFFDTSAEISGEGAKPENPEWVSYKEAVVYINDLDSLLSFFDDSLGDDPAYELGFSNSISPIYTIKDSVSIFMILSVVFKWFSIVLLVFAGILLFSNISGSVLDRKKDIGTLRAIGASGTDVSKIFLFEALFIALGVATISTGVVIYASNFTNNWMADEFSLSFTLFNVTPMVVLTVFGVAILAAIISSILPAKGVSMMRPIDAIKK